MNDHRDRIAGLPVGGRPEPAPVKTVEQRLDAIEQKLLTILAWIDSGKTVGR